MKVDGLTSRSIDAHGLVTIRWEEEMAMICSHDAVLDAGGGELSDGPGNIVDHGVHSLSGVESEASLASVVDLLRSDHDNRCAVDLLGEPRRLQTEQLVKGN